ncbi:queuine tRNA-ribosyltransferase, putative [Plasmodium malariae]|uniref:Queuine tRNA-ribosyltransferase, putative n=1 Tax=Plasmodium malariae TaxID=5858 RepID=A0A1A8X4H8_PLAMA|nr:queuine tRNA-ribosyltransferase, putative [Plasmodium malariae]SBS99498.1 queuine tRNA-ribosyltransferase, putative (TGT) [Plasmodium malariae]SCP03694.1 queuine tRNA-ribosyltransferase, putative [Plasmodium malariae]
MNRLICPLFVVYTLVKSFFILSVDNRIIKNETIIKGADIRVLEKRIYFNKDVVLKGVNKRRENCAFVKNVLTQKKKGERQNYFKYDVTNYIKEIKRNYYNNTTVSVRKNYNVLKESSFDSHCFTYPGFDFTILKENKRDHHHNDNINNSDNINDYYYYNNNRSRVGVIKTPRGNIETPNFLFCATKACMKSTPINFIKNCKTQVILSNTFHLLVHPKPHVIFRLGGLHKFMNWQGPILTDSGGYQLFSMTFGSVSDEIKRKSGHGFDLKERGVERKGKINDEFGKTVEVKKAVGVVRAERVLQKERMTEIENAGRWNRNDYTVKCTREKEATRSNNRVCQKNEIILKINERGALYKSYYDGSVELLSPETSIQSQYMLGSDLVVVLDECTPYHVNREYTERSMHRSHRWYIRCLMEFYRANNMINYHNYLNDIYNEKYKTNEKWNVRVKNKQALYGIIQGGIYTELRKKSCDFVCSLPFFGLCIGGCLGNNKEMMYSVINKTMNFINVKKPIHLLGIGQIKDIFFGVKQGIDTFDCVIPSRLARHGYFLCKVKNIKEIEKKLSRIIKNEYIKIKLSIFKLDSSPLESDCQCYTCLNYSRAYLYHLFKIQDNLLGTLLTIHNVYYMNQLMYEIRAALWEDNLDEIEKRWVR